MPDSGPAQILLLTRKPSGNSIIRLQEAASTRTDCELQVLDPHAIRLHTGSGGTRVSIDGLELQPGNCVAIPRLGSLSTEYSLYCLEQLERTGIPSTSSFSGLLRLRNKYSALAALTEAGLPVPDSVMLRNQAELGPAVDSVGGYPLVIKFIRGSLGVGVIVAEREDTVRSVLDALNLVQYDVLLQRYLPEAASRGTIRVLVVGGRARLAVHLTPAEGRDRSNVHAGGSPSAMELTDELATLAERSAALFDMGTAGVDLVDTASGMVLMEVNGSPGFEAPEEIYGADVATMIIESALELL